MMRVLLNPWLGHEMGFKDKSLSCDVCGKLGATAQLKWDYVCANCLNEAIKALAAARLEECGKP